MLKAMPKMIRQRCRRRNDDRFFCAGFRHGLFLLIGVSVLAFLFAALAPGNYFDEMRLTADCAGDYRSAASQYGIDRPLPMRYASWVNSLLHGNMGFSFAYNSAVAPILMVRARNTLLLTATSTLLAWAIAYRLESGAPSTLAIARPTAFLGNRRATGDSRSWDRVGTLGIRRAERMVSVRGNGLRRL